MEQSNKPLLPTHDALVVTQNGRPLARIPTWILWREEQFFLRLIRLDVSDVGVFPVYRPLIEIVKGNTLTIIIRTRAGSTLIYLAPRKIFFQTIKAGEEWN